MQPLDVSYFKSFMSYYDMYLTRWLKNHCGRTFGLYQIARAVAEAFSKASSVQIAVNGFRKTGIWPFNNDIFEEWEFAASKTTEDPEFENRDLERKNERSPNLKVNPYENPTPSTSGQQNLQMHRNDHDLPLSTLVANQSPSKPKKVKIVDISPLPISRKREKKVSSRRSLKSTILTEPPYKNELEASHTTKSPQNAKRAKRAIVVENDKQCVRKSGSNQNKTINISGDSANVDDTRCIVCDEKYSESGEDWYSCHECSMWAHESCGVMDELYFTCATCEG